jgi:NTE family protein
VSELGLVLAGGASRGAYEAGVLRFVFTELPKRLGFTPWPQVVSGTSVGALNGSFVVARDLDGLGWMSRQWQTVTVDQVFGISYGDLFRTLRALVGGQPFSVADPRPLQRMVARHFPLAGVRQGVQEHGVTWMVGATDLVNGTQVMFVDSRDPPTWRARPGVRYVHTPIRARHALASGALPLLFPPIAIDGGLYVDGGLRQNTPLGPVLRAGARKVLVVSNKSRSLDDLRAPAPPNLVFLVGKLLNALLLDPVEVDLYDAERLNELIRWGTRTFGPDFATRLEADLGLREAEVLFVSPSQDLGLLAADLYRARPPSVNGLAAQLLERAAAQSGPDADLLSYIYFDREYTAVLESLGFEDAKKDEERIAALVGA